MKANDRSMIIIGAGFAGLCAGIYAQMNGYRTQIFEIHSLPIKLSAVWVALMLTYLLGDVLRIFAGDFKPGEISG